MDERRLNTMDILAMGITSLPAPETDIPENREELSVWAYESSWQDEDDLHTRSPELKGKLEQGVVLSCSEYYGIPYIWKERGKYRGVLLQYRAVTEDCTFDTAEEAIEWFKDTADQVAG